MAGVSTISRLAVLLFLFRQICGTVIPIPEEMVPDNLMVRDSDSESGYSINQDVLNQLLKRVYSSSIVKRTELLNDQVKCRVCENEEKEHQNGHEENGKENMNQEKEKSNYYKQSGIQMSKNRYETISSRKNLFFNNQKTQEHSPIHMSADSKRETFLNSYPPRAPTVRQRDNEHVLSSPSKSGGVEYQTGQYPFTEFSLKTYEKSKQINAPISNQYIIQDSPVGIQQMYEQQKSTTWPTVQSSTQTLRSSENQPTQNVVYVQQEQQGQREQPPGDYRQYSMYHYRTPEHQQPTQEPVQPRQKLQIGNVSVRKRYSHDDFSNDHKS